MLIHVHSASWRFLVASVASPYLGTNPSSLRISVLWPAWQIPPLGVTRSSCSGSLQALERMCADTCKTNWKLVVHVSLRHQTHDQAGNKSQANCLHTHTKQIESWSERHYVHKTYGQTRQIIGEQLHCDPSKL